MYESRTANIDTTMNFRDFLEQEKHSFSCMMYVLTQDDADYVLNWSKKNIPDIALFTDGEKGREEEIHITILYGLHTHNVEDVRPIVRQFSPSEIKFGKITKFESEKYDVIKIDVDGEILRGMNKALKALPYTSNFPDYKPHCTLAYVEKGSCDHLIGNRYFSGWKCKVTDVVFSPADGDKTKLSLKKEIK